MPRLVTRCSHCNPWEWFYDEADIAVGLISIAATERCRLASHQIDSFISHGGGAVLVAAESDPVSGEGIREVVSNRSPHVEIRHSQTNYTTPNNYKHPKKQKVDNPRFPFPVWLSSVFSPLGEEANSQHSHSASLR